MRSGHNTMTGFVSVIAALLLVIIGLTTRWPLWAWPLAAGLLLAGTAIALVRARRRRPLFPPERSLEPELPIPPLERWECVVKDITLPSRSEDYDFRFAATVRWVPQDEPSDPPVINTAGLAVEAVLDRARYLTSQAEPHRSSLVEHQLNGELATMQPDARGRVTAMAEDVRLTLADADRERLEKLATVRKNEAVWEHERRWERSKRAYLGEDVLASPGSAVVWWLAKNDEKIDKTVSDIGLLAELASAAHDQPVPEDFHRFIPELEMATAGPADQESTPRPTAPGSLDEYVDWVLRNCGLAPDDMRLTLYVERLAKAAELADLLDLRDALLRRINGFPPPPWDGNEDPEPPAPPADEADPFDD